MNIVYICDVDISQPNGPGVNEREFCWTLQTQSALRGDKAFFLIPKPAQEVDFRLEGVAYYPRMGKASALTGFRMLLTSTYLLGLIVRTLQRTDVDLFVMRLNLNCALVPLILLLLRQRYAIKTLGNIYGFDRENVAVLKRFYFWGFRRLLGLVLKKATFIDVCTAQFYRNYRDIYSLERLEVIENSVNTSRFYVVDREVCKAQCGLKRFDKIVGYCGGYPSSRGARQLVEISPGLMGRYPRCGILIIGEDDQLPFLRERAEQLGTSDHIVFQGTVDYTQVPTYMNCMDVGIGLDEEENVGFFGNSSQKIRQYLACGVPVVCPKGTNDIIVNAELGLPVSAGDLDEVFGAVCHWLDKADESIDAFRARAHEFAEVHLSSTVAYEKRYERWKEALERMHRRGR